MSKSIELISQSYCFDGEQWRFQHNSSVNHCPMTFSIFLPPNASTESPVPLVYWLSGLTCTDENFMQKAGAQRYAAKYGLAIVCPDTSPRGENIPDDPDNAYDFGLGAGFYVDATQSPWNGFYNMYSYITRELPSVLEENFKQLNGKASIMGHSMGGHGALTIALRNPKQYQSVSAFAPICSPMQCPWGLKALENYLGPDRSAWKNHDACELILSGAGNIPLLVDQGSADDFLEEQLKPELLQSACGDMGQSLTLNMRPNYDHSYYFIGSFIENHIAYHHQALCGSS